MKDKEILQWVYERMINIHNENPNVDYMLRFKKVIDSIKEPRQEIYRDPAVNRYGYRVPDEFEDYGSSSGR